MTIWSSPEFDDHEHVSFFSDPKTGLRVIVSIHSSVLGPAVGGTRFKAYENDQLAVDDALRLSRAMSYKSALAGMPVGGGKAVIIGNPSETKTRELLHAYGRFLNRLGDQFTTGEDVGILGEDVATINEVCPHVGGISSEGAGDPSVHTADGVMYGLQAVLEHRMQRSSFDSVHIAVEGLGAVGWGVAKRLHAAGAKLTVSDIRADVAARAALEFDAKFAPVGEIHAADVDIYAPCALGGVITENTASEIRACAVAGAANNQLASKEAGDALRARDITYAPDYVMNAGGVISALEETCKIKNINQHAVPPLSQRLAGIYSRLLEILEEARRKGVGPEVVAEHKAREILGKAVEPGQRQKDVIQAN